MGCGCSNNQSLIFPPNSSRPPHAQSTIHIDHTAKMHLDLFNNTYRFFNFKSKIPIDDSSNINILLYTLPYNSTGDSFVSLSKFKEEKAECNNYKGSGDNLLISYNKGEKLNDLFNKDKFFVLIDGDFQVYCLIDGHGPFGDLIGQIVQDKLFIKLNKCYTNNFLNEYEEIFLDIFEDIQNAVVNNEVKLLDEYDSILSGLSVSLVVVKENYIYTVNIGNVLAMIVHNDTTTVTKNEIDILTIDDSDLYNDNYEKENKRSTEDYDIINIHGVFDMNDELRRIYESGGEVRQIGGEEKGRIFVKGKYYPGVINTRGIGDQIAGLIGVSHKPHISKMKMEIEHFYYLFMCTDGVANCDDCERLANLIVGSERSSYIFYTIEFTEVMNNILSIGRGKYSGPYLPDMTLILRRLM